MDKLKQSLYLDLELINAVQIYLQILYISDITSHDGMNIINVTQKYQMQETGRPSLLPWTEKLSPGVEAWK